MNVKELKAKMQAALKAARDICDIVDKAERDFTPEERNQVKGYLDEANKFKGQIQDAEGDSELRKTMQEMGEEIDFSGNGGGPSGGEQKLGKRFIEDLKHDTLGEAFIRSQTWQNYIKSIAPGGHIPDKLKGISSPPVEFKRIGLFRKDVLTGGDPASAGAFVAPDYTGIYEPIGRYPLTMRDLLSVRTTTSDTVHFVRQVTQVTQAEPTPESNVTKYTGASGEVSGEKPEGSMTFEQVTENVRNIPVWIPATKRALSDAGQLRSLIDEELRSDVNEELENQIINGSGVGENFTGLANTAGVLTQAFDTDIVRTSRTAITNLLVNGRQFPTAWAMHPSDWERFDLAQDTGGRYYWGGPMAQGPRTLWGVPVVQNFFVAQGTAYLGNWRKAVLWDREQITISVTDSHSDFFIRNMVAILCELRAAFGVIRPSGFVEVDLEGGS
jgi:HK97 family phage major capsid protein